MRVKNWKETSDTWCGQIIASGAEYDLQASELWRWQSDDKVLADLVSGDLAIGDGIAYKPAGSEAINFLLGVDSQPKDSTGRPIVRSAVTNDGWTAQFHSFSFKTSNLGSVYSKDYDGNDLNFATLKLYDVNGTEITDPINNSQAVKTVIDWMPNHDFDIVGGQLFQTASPTQDLHLWLVGLPGILNVKFSQGGFNLRLLGDQHIVDFDGRATKFLPYNGGIGTNRFRLIFKHAAGFEHELQMLMRIFKA